MKTIQDVITDINRKIAGKEFLHETYSNPGVQPYPTEVMNALAQYISMNIEELKQIVSDLEDIK